MTDPQAGTTSDQWRTHEAVVNIEDMDNEHVLNAYKTCKRHDNPKAIDLHKHLWARGLLERV